MRVLVITSCTSQKAVEHAEALTQEDFAKEPTHRQGREAALAEHLKPAEELYTGQQHVRLMRGVNAFRAVHPTNGKGPALELRILSAGYGLVAGDKKLAPYEMTFQGMRKTKLRRWADALGVPTSFQEAVRAPYDLGLILLGDDYLEACRLEEGLRFGGPTLLFCGKNTLARLPKSSQLQPIPLTNQEAKRFSCGLVALKGELATRILNRLADDSGFLARLTERSASVLELLSESPPAQSRARAARAKPEVDQVISIPPSWSQKPHRDRLQYFIPEWDDLVDRDYDFENDVHSGGTGDWSNEVYAHQLYPEPNYDGILISKVIAEKNRKKKERINRLGVHRFLRVPESFPIMGDCGAFGYIQQENPPYKTSEILDYYDRLGFNFGVSIDHLIVTSTEASKQHRYQLTIDNAEEFLREHRKARLGWTPIGAIQGWDPQSYASAARKYVAMGYEYIALGGLVRSPTSEVLEVLRAVHEVVPPNVRIHLFGLARINSMHEFARLGVRSVDSASLLRRAWMGGGQNYLTLQGDFYAAIRIPEAGKSFRAKRMVSDGRATSSKVERLERACWDALLAFERGALGVDKVLDTLEEYDSLITPERPSTRALLRETLEAKPWRACPCNICKTDGIQVIVFRGNNRNRRRGFHNTYVFYQLLQRVLRGETVSKWTVRRGGEE